LNIKTTLETNDFAGKILQIKCYARCYILLYQVHAPKADARLSAALLCYFRCSLCWNLAAVSCILHWIAITLSTMQMGITLIIVFAWHCYGYITITKCP